MGFFIFHDGLTRMLQYRGQLPAHDFCLWILIRIDVEGRKIGGRTRGYIKS